MTEPGARVFISHRHGNSGHAQAVCAGLAERQVASIFFDRHAIDGGARFASVIEDHLAVCDVVLVIIDPIWMQTRQRLQARDDWVRRELVQALQRPVPLIPVLVGGVARPKAADLPGELRELARAEPHRQDLDGWPHRLDQLVERIREQLELANRRRSRFAAIEPMGGDPPGWTWKGVVRMERPAVYRLLSDALVTEHPSAVRKGLLVARQPDTIVLRARNSWLDAAAIAIARENPASIQARQLVVCLEAIADGRSTQIVLRADRPLERALRRLVNVVVETRLDEREPAAAHG